jgi:HEAT repeat protein
MLIDDKSYVREEAAWILGEMKQEEATEPLIQMLNGSDEGAWMAAIALGKIASEKSVPSLTRALENESIKIRRAAAWALCQTKSADAVKHLRTALKDEDEDVRYWAAEALKTIEDSIFEEESCPPARRPVRGSLGVGGPPITQ